MDDNGQSLNRIFCSRTTDFKFLVIPKCGCTFLKNVLWRIDHNGTPFENPERIHSIDEAFLKASELTLSPIQMRREDKAFAVVRDPVSRFFSFYSDKVIGPGRRNFINLRDYLIPLGFNYRAEQDVEHAQNCRVLLSWIKMNLSGKTEIFSDPHWTPQSWRKKIIESCNLKIIRLPFLNAVLPEMFNSSIPNLRKYLDESERYSSGSATFIDEIVDESLRAEIESLYSEDAYLWAKISAWHDLNEPTALPRWSDIFST